MRLLIQRVSEASVIVDGETIGAIGRGLLAFLGVHRDDRPEDTVWLKSKLVNLRLFADESGKLNRSVQEVGGEVLVVSQFTLYGSCERGRRPEFTRAASGDLAERVYNKFVDELRAELGSVQTGQFAAEMKVRLINDGPITLIVDGKAAPSS